VANVDAVSELCRCPWEAVFEMKALEFLNILCYRAEKLKKQDADAKKWEMTH